MRRQLQYLLIGMVSRVEKREEGRGRRERAMKNNRRRENFVLRHRQSGRRTRRASLFLSSFCFVSLWWWWSGWGNSSCLIIKAEHQHTFIMDKVQQYVDKVDEFIAQYPHVVQYGELDVKLL